MKRLLAALLLVASPVLAQATNGWAEIANGWGEIQTPPSSIPAPSLPDAGKVPAVNAGGTAYELITVAGTGTVTSVTLTVPSIFAVSGSPITTTGTFGVTLATQAKNLVWAGPTTGADAAPTFRALVAADLGSFTLSPSFRLVTIQDATGDTTPFTVRASTAPGTAALAQWQASDSSPLGTINHDGSITAPGFTGPLTGNASTATSATSATTAGAVTTVVASKLLGRGSAGGDGNSQDITLGTNLAMSGTTLNATGGGVTNSAGANVIPKSDGTNIVASSITDTGSAITVGTASGTPQAFTYKLAADGTGTNIAAGSATILPGIGTGTGAASRLLLGGPIRGSTGSTVQSTATPVSIGGEVKANGTESFLNVTGTLPASPSAAVAGVNAQVTTAGSASQQQIGANLKLLAGYSGSSETFGALIENAAASTASPNWATGSYGVRTFSSGGNYGGGLLAYSTTPTRAVALYGGAQGTTLSVGVYGTATSTSTTAVGGYFAIAGANWYDQHGTAPVSAALLAENGSTGSPIFVGRDNGTTKVSIEDGGALCGNNSKTLTESSATGFVEIAVASNQVTSAIIDYEIEANDSTDFQTLVGSVYVSGVNKAGTVTATVGEVGTPLNAVSTGTLTNTMTVTAGTGKFTVNANAVSSLTQTTLRIKYLVRAPKPVAATSL